MDYSQSSGNQYMNSPNGNKKILNHSKSARRLSRKPSLLFLNSPSSKNCTQSQPTQQFVQIQSPSSSRFNRSKIRHKIDNKTQIGNICYISPRNAKLQTYKSPPSNKNMEGYISIKRIETEQILDFSEPNFTEKQVQIKIPTKGHKKKLSKTSKEFHEIMKNCEIDSSYCTKKNKRKDVQSEKSAQLDSSFMDQSIVQYRLNYAQEENQSLRSQNRIVNQRLQNLREQNHYLYSQIENFNLKIAKLMEENQKLLQNSKKLNEKIEENEYELQYLKKGYKENQKIRRKYQVLQYVYNKSRQEQMQSQKRVKDLTLQNQRMHHKIIVLSRMLQESSTTKKSQSKQKNRKHSLMANKQNWSQSVNCDNKGWNFNVRNQKFNKLSRKEESFFQLSPE